jgi:hypothetical protein
VPPPIVSVAAELAEVPPPLKVKLEVTLAPFQVMLREAALRFWLSPQLTLADTVVAYVVQPAPGLSDTVGAVLSGTE